MSAAMETGAMVAVAAAAAMTAAATTGAFSSRAPEKMPYGQGRILG